MNSAIFDSLWIEKYRPKTLKDIILPKETIESINSFKKKDAYPNLFLCSRPGQGKTSLAHILTTEFDSESLYINCSDENNVDTVRTKISDFARTRSFNGRFKTIILDEADGFANIQSQKILRALMEEVAANTRFIITANYKNRIIDAVRSRCQVLDVTPAKEDIARRIIYILQTENVEVTREDIPKIFSVVTRYYPDVRSVIKNIQASVHNGKLEIRCVKTDAEFMNGIYSLMRENKWLELREYIVLNENLFNYDYVELLNDFYHFMIDIADLEASVKAKWAVTIAEYLYRSESINDQEINTTACFYTLMGVV